jgi:hypothetical protein
LNDSLRKEIDLLHSKYDEIATKYSEKKVLKAKNKQKKIGKHHTDDREAHREEEYEQQSEEPAHLSACAQHLERPLGPSFVEPPPAQYVPYVYRVNNWDRFFGY